MIVKADSWHWKLITLVFSEFALRYQYSGGRWKPLGLCQYFWMVVGAIIWSAIMAIVGLLSVAGVLTLLFYQPFITLYTGEWVPTSFISFGLWAIMVSGIISGVYHHRVPHVKKVKEPGLIKSYLKAKKSKFCPTIIIKN